MKENVKVSTLILNKVREYTKKTRQTVGGFYDLAAEEKLAKEKLSAKIKSSTKK